MTVVGVDGCPAGWVAVAFDTTATRAWATVAPSFSALLETVSSPECVLVDIPIGLPTVNHPRRACDVAARDRLRPTRHASVFDPPLREVFEAETYEAANETQRQLIGRGLPIQSWAIVDRIRQVDRIRRDEPPAYPLREAHPEVCFAALSDGPTRYSKTGQPAAAVWERVSILERVLPDASPMLRSLGRDVDATVSNHDLLDAFVLAVVASDRTGPLKTLPRSVPTDSVGLPMEIVYACPGEYAIGGTSIEPVE